MNHELKKVKEQLCDMAVRLSEQGVSRNLEGIYMAVVAAEKIEKMKVLEEGSEKEYSERRGGYSRDSGNSERGRSSYDSDGGSYRGGNSYDGGGSSYDGGNSYGNDHGKDHMIRSLERLMDETRTPEDREAIKKFIKQFQNS